MKLRASCAKVLLTGLVGLFSLALAACSGSSSPTSTSGPPSRSTVLKPGQTVAFSLARNARTDVQAVSCEEQAGAWEMTGTVKNKSATTTSFQIVVDFVTRQGDTVLSTSLVTVPGVASGATTDWSATGARGKSGVACIIRQSQTT